MHEYNFLKSNFIQKVIAKLLNTFLKSFPLFGCTLCLLIRIKLPPLFRFLFMTEHSGKGSCWRCQALGNHLIPLSNMILNYTSTLNSYLRVADKNVIFFPHNHHNVHISLEALNATDCSVDGIIGTNNKLTFPTNQRSENRD